MNLPKRTKLLSLSLSSIFILSIISISYISQAEAGVGAGSTLNSGFGTPTIDGVINPAEWSGAATLSVFSGAYAGSTLYVMNDETNLYMALDVNDAVHDLVFPTNDIWDVRFDNALNQAYTDNDDQFKANSETPTDFLDDAHFDAPFLSWRDGLA